MIRIVLDAELRSKLHNLAGPIELCNESGGVVARIVPVLNPAEYEAVEPQISREELERRKQSSRWYTTAEVLRHLESL